MDEMQWYVSYQYTRGESLLLMQLFELLEAEGIRYIVLRGYNLLPSCCISAGTNDIDILVDWKVFAKTLKLFTSLGFTEPFIRGRHYDAVAQYIPFTYRNIRIDVWEHLGHKSLMTDTCHRLDPDIEQEMLESRVLVNDLFYVALPPYEVAHLTNRIILDKKGLVPAYYECQIRHLMNVVKGNNEYENILRHTLGRTYRKASNLIMDKLFRNELNTLREDLLCFQDY